MSRDQLALPGLLRNAVVAASAGTGKTQLVTSIYLAHVLGLGASSEPLAAERAVATTFSRAAAQEIRERLESRLLALADGAGDGRELQRFPELAALAAERGIAPREIQRRAARALAELPRTLIDTLHGLAARVLRAHAVELGLPPGFTILDEQAAIEDEEGAIDEVLSHALSEGGERAAAVLALIDAASGLELLRGALHGLLSLLDEEGLDADALATRDHAADARDVAGTLSAAARAVLACGPGHPLRAAATAALTAIAAGDDADPALLRSALDVLFASNKTQRERDPAGSELAAGLDALLRPKDAKAKRVRATSAFLVGAGRLGALDREIAELVARVQRHIRRRRSARGALGFGDLARLARDALRDHPAIAAREGAAIELLLVDEYQDTSRVQRDLILLLREEPSRRARRRPGSVPGAEDVEPRGLVIVGDRKQSIYAFRGADVAVYTRLAAELAGEAAARALDLRGVAPSARPVADFYPLTTNYRSGSGILRFVNAVARADFAEDPEFAFEIRYTDAEALVPPRGAEAEPGRVTLLEDDGAVPEGADAVIQGAKGPLRTALVVAGYCARLREAGTQLTDLAILARRRSTLPLVELALDRLGIPFVVSGRALYGTPEVRDFAALLRLSLDPYDRHALATVARSPLGGLSDRTLVALARPGRGLSPAHAWDAPAAAIDDAEQRSLALELAERLAELGAVAPRLSPRDALAFACERFETERVLAGLPRGAVRFGNVGRLLEIAARHGGSLPMFVRWLDRQIALEVDETEAAVFSEDDDAVRLLTIHASKGLSFPVTIVVDLGAQEQPRSSPLALFRSGEEAPELVVRHRGPDGPAPTALLARHSKEAQARAAAERQRLSYVALTRARRELVLALPAEPPRAKTLAASVARVLESDAVRGDPALRALPAAELLSTPSAPFAEPKLPPPAPSRPELAPFRTAAIGVTALADFAVCPRRFFLLHVVGLEEPGLGPGGAAAASDDARSIGSAAHRVLETFPLERWGEAVPADEIVEALGREGLDAGAEATRATAEGIRRFLGGRYAAAARGEGARVRREVELTVSLDLPEPSARPSRQLDLFQRERPARRALLKATLDLVVEHADGMIDVIDYKRSRGGDEERYAPQLAAYRKVALASLGARSVRIGLVHLLGNSAEPAWFDPGEVDLAKLVGELAERRYRDDYPPVPEARCRRARCGFVAACHPRRRAPREA